MERREVRGTLASGDSYYATPVALEIRSPAGRITASFDTRFFETVERSCETISITRPANPDLTFTAASPEDARALEAMLQLGAAAPTPVRSTYVTSDSRVNDLLRWGCIAALAAVGLLSVSLLILLFI